MAKYIVILCACTFLLELLSREITVTGKIKLQNYIQFRHVIKMGKKINAEQINVQERFYRKAIQN